MLGSRYQLRGKLAEGGMAEIFLADYEGDDGLVRQVVVKRILREFSKDQAFVSMFMGEAKLIAKLNHPNIIKLTDFGIDDGCYFLTMEYVDGFHLRSLRKRADAVGRPVPYDLAARMVSQACTGLGYAHAYAEDGKPLNLIHRDISPENLLIGRNGVVKVADFGIARVEGQVRTTRTGMVKGKLLYMAPEQLKAEPVDHRADIFAMGIVLYELACGRRPFDGATDRQTMQVVIDGRPAPLVSFRPDAPVALQNIIDRAMAHRPEDRYQTCGSMALALELFSARTSSQALAVFVADISPVEAVTEAKTEAVALPKPAPEPMEAPQPGFTLREKTVLMEPRQPAPKPPAPRVAPPSHAPAAPAPASPQPSGEFVNPAAFRRSPKGPIAGGVLTLVLASFLLGRMFSGSDPAPAATPMPAQAEESTVAEAPAKEKPAELKPADLKPAPVKAPEAKPAAEEPLPKKEVAAASPPVAKKEVAVVHPAPGRHPSRPEKVAPAPHVAARPEPPPAETTTAPVRKPPPESTKNSGATDEWAGMGTPPTGAPAPAAAPAGLAGRVGYRASTGYQISNDTDFAWHRCQVRLPNAKFFDFYDTPIDAHRQVIIRDAVLAADSESADAYVIQGYALLRCTEGRKYIQVN